MKTKNVLNEILTGDSKSFPALRQRKQDIVSAALARSDIFFISTDSKTLEKKKKNNNACLGGFDDKQSLKTGVH